MRLILAVLLMFSSYVYASCDNISNDDQRNYCKAKQGWGGLPKHQRRWPAQSVQSTGALVERRTDRATKPPSMYRLIPVG
ncbi:hypothetical protein BK658_09245 [Pseudomonas brassicacearum]|uniref:Lipoprotein n=1 Tax=Pseudomonas brassicacearum TaxID=930166 RepID=A0A423GU08_9PSED|nr:hypothetical protein BK658_09245 [Pseudomonas brassicacearum]